MVGREDSLKSVTVVAVDDISSSGLEILSAFTHTMICPLQVHPVCGLSSRTLVFLAAE